MKDNISIIFAAIIGTFLIVLLPLYSILDRQDSMAYNVVLTATTNFVDDIRNKGFIDKESYTKYLGKLASTGNTYKVKIEAYKNVLLPEKDAEGNVVSYVEEKELYNTKDIEKILEGSGSNGVDLESSSKKNNVYLFEENDDIYIKVYNTNITAGSIIYTALAGKQNTKVVDISYGGVINKVNWELYDKIQTGTTLAPEVVMSVPVNKDNNTNIQPVNSDGSTEYIDCVLENLEDYTGEMSLEELCADYAFEEGKNYTYLYDLSIPENKTIKVALELRRFMSIDIGQIREGKEDTYIPLSELKKSSFTGKGSTSSEIEQYIISNYIRLNGMYANIDLNLRAVDDYYVFDVVLTDVRMSVLDYISSRANITILPGLGQDGNGVLSMGSESIEIELMDKTLVNAVEITKPIIWKKFLRTKSIAESQIQGGKLYKDEEIAFVISHTGIKKAGLDESSEPSDEAIKQAIYQHLEILPKRAIHSDVEIYTVDELQEKYDINLATETAGHILVKFKYTSANNVNENYVKLKENWITMDNAGIIDPETGEEIEVYAKGVSSTKYQVLVDDVAPKLPTIILEGTKGENEWYTSNVKVNLVASLGDQVRTNGVVETGGSGVEKNTMTITGATSIRETEENQTLTTDGISNVTLRAYDFVGNVAEGNPIKIKVDQTPPSAPIIEVIQGDKGANDWYTSDVKIKITPGEDATSKVKETTYKIEGANELGETEGTTYTLKKEGLSTITATTYDNAGNSTSTTLNISIEQKESVEIPDAQFEVIEGSMYNTESGIYNGRVKLKITVNSGEVTSGLGVCKYSLNNGEVIELKNPIQEAKNVRVYEVEISEQGQNAITVLTNTRAGNSKATSTIINIDSTAPVEPNVALKTPTGDIAQGVTISGRIWYNSKLQVEMTNISEAYQVKYGIAQGEAQQQETILAVQNKDKLIKEIQEDGQYILNIIARDEAFNESRAVTLNIGIDTVSPTAEFIIKSNSGKIITKPSGSWYNTDVYISSSNTDNGSGISETQLSHSSILENTDENGVNVSLLVKDKAGNETQLTNIIKVDKTEPELSNIEFSSAPIGELLGVNMFNENINVIFTPATDNISAETTYTIKKINNNGEKYPIKSDVKVESETREVLGNGKYEVSVKATDLAGNTVSQTKNVWINSDLPEKPEIYKINSRPVSSNKIKIDQSNTDEKLRIEFSNVDVGNTLHIKIDGILTDVEVPESKIIEIDALDIGEHNVKISQTNMFIKTSYEKEYEIIVE